MKTASALSAAASRKNGSSSPKLIEPAMKISLVSTGEEILRGEVVDTNAAWAAELLDRKGFELSLRLTCGDGLADLSHCLRLALSEADVVISCGGLGPTVDDRTAEAAAAVLGVELIEDPEIVARLKAGFEAMSLPYTDNQARQARLPDGAEAIANPRGTAPGIACKNEAKLLFCLPGPPREFRGMLEDSVLERLEASRRARGETGQSVMRVLKIFGKGEGWIAKQLGDLEDQVPGLVLGYRAATPEIHVKLRADHPEGPAAQKVLDAAEALVRERLGDLIFTADKRGFPQVILDRLRKQGLRLATAESCTGGLIGKLLTDLPGASEAFVLSAVTYANEAKQAMLGVPESLLAEHGAVSEECARAMAEGALRISGADLSVAVTGIAGPGGGTEDKPVGTVWFATAGPDGTRTKLRTFPPFERDFIRRVAAYSALALVAKRLPGHKSDL
jgi:nicotinamide-nucleotide amidase